MAIERQRAGVGAQSTVVIAADGHRIATTRWEPAGTTTPSLAVQVLHGLGEHLGRYERFAAACRVRGFAVIGHDHRGHGPHCEPAALGHFADRNGWDKVVDDAIAVQAHARRRWPEARIVLFGHSMGSYIAQSFAARAPEHVAALALSGSHWPSRTRVRLGRTLARLSILAFGGRHSSALLRQLGLGNFNRRFAPARTSVDWLSRDEAEVDRYVADPYCGIPLSNRLWHDLLGGLLEVGSLRTLRRIPADLPILITGGSQDPVGGRRGMQRLADAYERTGHGNVALKIWSGGRHEMLNEIDRDAFTEQLLQWIETHRVGPQ